jgi:hypothetical protein
MKKLFRLTVFVLLVGGWATAISAVQVVRTQYRSIPYVITKEQIGFKDTYLDTRAWTISDVKQHPEMVEHVLRLNRADILANTVPVQGADVAAQLQVAVMGSGTATASATHQPTPLDHVATGIQKIETDVKARTP